MIINFQVKILEEKIFKLENERNYFRNQWEKLHQAAMTAARNSSQASLINGSPNDLHIGGHGGQLDLSLNGVAAAAAAANAAHDDYKRDPVNGYQNNNDLKLGTLRWVLSSKYLQYVMCTWVSCTLRFTFVKRCKYEIPELTQPLAFFAILSSADDFRKQSLSSMMVNAITNNKVDSPPNYLPMDLKVESVDEEMVDMLKHSKLTSENKSDHGM